MIGVSVASPQELVPLDYQRLKECARTVLTGEGVSGGQTAKPDVWIPDSSLWSGLVQAANEKAVTPTKVSIASTPVVVAVPQTLALYLQKNGFTDSPSWDNLLRAAGGMEGGPNNPLGPRALYLYRGGRDTNFRLHGTIEPETIGQPVSSGCIRLFNQDIIDLYDRVPVGAKVVVIS